MRDNAGRAERAEAALLAYIDHTGDSRNANELETWISDLLCDLRHLCKFMRTEFNGDAGEYNFVAECQEEPRGVFNPQWDGWYTIAAKERKRRRAEKKAKRT